MPTFRTPTMRVYPNSHDRFERLMGVNRGITVLKTGGFYREVIEPTPEEIGLADEVYLGGHLHVISEDEAADLTAAGYGQYIGEG